MDPNKSVSLTDDNLIIALYRKRMSDYGQKKEKLDRVANWISHARVVTSLAAGVCLLTGFFGESDNTAWLIGGGVLVIVFFVFVGVHERVLVEAERHDQLNDINRQAIARVLRKWDQIPRKIAKTLSSDEALACDLDLFGEASLFHLVCTANTPIGIDMLRDWFLHPADPVTVVKRQQAVAEIAPALDTRQEQQRRGLKVAAHKTNIDQFLQWAEAKPWLAQRRWQKWASRFMPFLLLAFIFLSVMGSLPPLVWLVPFVINIVISFVYRRQMHAIFGTISNRQGKVSHYVGLFELIAKMSIKSDKLKQLHQKVVNDEADAWREIQMLGRISDMANIRFSSASHFLIQSVLLWDFHVLTLLERWQCRNRNRVRIWFEVLAEWEALASLAALAHDNPAWVFPVIQHQPQGEQMVCARSLGHPLISDDRRVCNDVTIGPPETFLMVTGSNMSGKSTLLRAIGTNVILSQAGATVCASEFSMPPVLLATSMRIHDSLADGVSYYMAELKRLKQIVDASRDQQSSSSQTLLYLLDELLQGTNTAERQIAVRRVLTHLLAKGAIGAISTHDLQLATATPLLNVVHAVHFRETIHNESDRQEMTFDYILREGLATSSNALKLLEIVGLNHI